MLQWETPDQAFPALLTSVLPSGLRGLVAAGLLAALMSSLASVFNSCATLFTVDIYKKLKPNTPEDQLVLIGRIATILVVIAGIAWIPVMQRISGVLYEYLQSVQSYIAPPIAAVFLLGIFSKRINEKGALVTLVVGMFIGFFRIGLELAKDSLEPGSLLFFLGDMLFLTFSAWFFLFCVILAVVVSLLTEKPSEEKLSGLTFQTLTSDHKEANRNSYNIWDIVVSLIVVAIVIFIMISFNGQ